MGADKSSATTTLGLLTPQEATKFLRVSLSWLAKARMRGDGPPYLQFGRSVRYSEAALILWMKSRQRLSTSKLVIRDRGDRRPSGASDR